MTAIANLVLFNQVLLAIVSILTFIVLRNWLGREQVTYYNLPEDRQTLCVEVSEDDKDSFEALAEHMGVSLEEALSQALNDWYDKNADTYDFNPSTNEESTNDTSDDA